MPTQVKWSLKSQSCPDDFDPSWFYFNTQEEANTFIRRIRSSHSTDLLTLYSPDFDEIIAE